LHTPLASRDDSQSASPTQLSAWTPVVHVLHRPALPHGASGASLASLTSCVPMSQNSVPCPTFRLEVAHRSDLGMRRINNQDAVTVIISDDRAAWMSRGHLMMVADGMGAHAAGELASKLAIDNVPHTYFKLRELYPPAALRQAVREANSVIYAKGQSSIGFQGMGTTCSCLVLLPQGALVAHVGDSRVYRLRGDRLEQLTFDHSLVWEMAAVGRMSEEDVPAYIPKNVITRSLGPHPNVNVDLEGPYNAAEGDVFLLCTDGLSGPVSDEELGAILQCLPPGEAVETLVNLANLRGGPDNISMVVARVAGEDAVPRAEATDASNGAAGVRPRQSTSWLWLAVVACAAVLGVCLISQYWIGAIASAVVLGTALAMALVGRAGPAASAPGARPIGGPYGNGPYRNIACEPSRDVTDALADLCTRLREIPDSEEGRPTVHWESFDADRTAAAAAANSGDYRSAVRLSCHAIRDVMQQLRGHRPPVSTDSGILPL
jgi:serine/threonine protein phosphatase PrpC